MSARRNVISAGSYVGRLSPFPSPEPRTDSGWKMQRSRKLAALAARLRPVLCKDGAVAPNFRAPAALDVERSANFHSSSQVDAVIRLHELMHGDEMT